MKSKKTTKVKKNAKSEDLDLLSSLPDDPPVSDVGSGSGSDHEEDNDDDGEHGNFLQQLAKLEGETR